MQALEARHLADLAFPEVSRALRALSSTYVERRRRLYEGAALAGAGKRAAFALFYGPLHYLLVEAIVRALPGAAEARSTIVDLGCGTGASGAAWAHVSGTPRVLGVDRHAWVLGEAVRTYRDFALTARTRQSDVASFRLPSSPSSVLLAFALNELPDIARRMLLGSLVDRARRGDRVLIVEPMARFVAPWWNEARTIVIAAGGRADEWRFPADLPAIVRKLDRAAGLSHRELTARTLWLPGSTRVPV